MLIGCTVEYPVCDTAELDTLDLWDGWIIDKATLKGDITEIRNMTFNPLNVIKHKNLNILSQGENGLVFS